MDDKQAWNIASPSLGRPFSRFLPALALVLVAGCGAPPPPPGVGAAPPPAPTPSRGDDLAQDAPPLEKEVKRLSKTVATLGHTAENSRAGTTEMAKRLDLMEKEISSLRGELEVARHDNRRLLDQVTDLNQKSLQPQPAPPRTGTDIATFTQPDSGLLPTTATPATPVVATTPPKNEATQVVAAHAPPSVTAPPKNTGQKPASADQAYSEADLNLKSGRYLQAGESFRNFIKWFPDDPRIPRAQYWIGEAYYAEKKFREALQEFNQVLLRWPKSEMVPGCLLKMGYSLYELGEMAKARAILNRLVKDFSDSQPDTQKVHMARQRLKLIADAQSKGKKEKEDAAP
ncbi:MAG: tol-pal system protein YbgF [Magnetococcales bacterium]|nr:tol-pal system protein YbgF [Magnetococcales bacterium]